MRMSERLKAVVEIHHPDINSIVLQEHIRDRRQQTLSVNLLATVAQAADLYPFDFFVDVFL